MDKPCIVCEENCPVSPKAIFTHEEFVTIRDGILTVKEVRANIIEVIESNLTPAKFATGDYYCATPVFSCESKNGDQRCKIVANTENSIEIFSDEHFEKILTAGSKIEIQVRLQRPYVDIEKCIGCGVCEHECPVSGKKAVRVSAEGETRSADRTLLLKGRNGL
jgi:Pyruvate/2-oxoacid:ferredoxin oxidoreductase delta subunit